MIGTACLNIACKTESRWAIPRSELARYAGVQSESAYRELILMERRVFMAVGADVAVFPTALFFLTLLLARDWDGGADDRKHLLARYCLGAVMMSEDFFEARPSEQAAAALYLARHGLGFAPAWTEALAALSGMVEEQVRPLAARAFLAVAASKTRPDGALERKYSLLSFQQVAAIEIPPVVGMG